MIVEERYELPRETRDELNERTVRWGFGPISEAVYMRTYSRLKEDGSQETWADTVCRVVEGVMSIRKHQYKMLGKRWDTTRWNVVAKELVYAVYDMKLLPPGRGLWAMGTEYVFERGSHALNNCGSIEVNGSLSNAASWLMDSLMCGVGVGFTTHTASLSMRHPRGDAHELYEIPDTKEGWAEATRRIIASYERGSRPVDCDYSAIRRAGAPIAGFGGVSAGAAPLRTLHRRLRQYLQEFADKSVDQTRVIADVMNAIGACVVAGNVRRSAEIAVGAPGDDTFMNLKNYELYPDRPDRP